MVNKLILSIFVRLKFLSIKLIAPKNNNVAQYGLNIKDSLGERNTKIGN